MVNRNTFNDQDAEELLGMLGDGKRLFEARQGKSPSYILQAPAGGIPAKSGSTVYWANCTVQSISSFSGTTSGSASLGSVAIDLPVFNLSTTAVAANALIVAVPAGGWLIAVWEDC